MERLQPEGYYPFQHTTGLWKHKWRSLVFSLLVDYFGVKYVGKQHADHFLNIIKYIGNDLNILTEVYSATFLSNGTNITAWSTYPCQDKSQSDYTNVIIPQPEEKNMCFTNGKESNMVPNNNEPHQEMTHPILNPSKLK